MKTLIIFLISLLITVSFLGCGSEGKEIVINMMDNEIEVEENESKNITIQSKDRHKQFRNNKKKITKADLKTYYKDDLTLKDFEVPKKTIEDYESWFIGMARDRGESAQSISDAFRSVDILLGEDIVKYPVILDTVIYNDKEAYAIAYLCEEGTDLDMEAQEAIELKMFSDVLVIGVYKDSADIFYENKYRF